MLVIPATQQEEIRRIAVQGQPWPKVSKTLSQQVSQGWWYSPVIPVVREASPGQKHETLSEK
jgi:hypothetical protein